MWKVKNPLKHGFYLPWWSIPIIIVIYPFAKIGELFSSKKKTGK